jgi:hypothetical protein
MKTDIEEDSRANLTATVFFTFPIVFLDDSWMEEVVDVAPSVFTCWHVLMD